MQKEWPQLYAKASTGKIKTWITWVVQIDSGAEIWTRHGYIDGKLTDKSKHISNGKNIGKANQTTPFEQACLEAKSAYKRKLDKKYITEIPDGDNEPDIYLPMLAKPFKKYKHHISYPCLVQPKLNGVRCLAKKISDTQINYTSRKGKSFNDTLGHLTKDLLAIMEIDEIFDGEIYKHDWTFQQIIRRVKKIRNDTHKLQFWVYDIANEDIAADRVKCYTEKIKKTLKPESKVVHIFTAAAHSDSDVFDAHNLFVQEGYEGVIVRNANAFYKFDHRSMDLQKYKEFIDKEFKIIGGVADTDDAIVFECITEDSKKFNVRPKGTLEQRQSWYKEIKNIIGLRLTVRYQELSEDGIPIFPVGIAIRDYE